MALKNLENLDIQQKLALVLERVQCVFVSIAGVLDPIVNNTGLLVSALTILAGFKFVSLASSLAPLATTLFGAASAATLLSSALTFGLGAAAIALGISAIYGAYQAFKPVDDVVIPPGGASFISGPAGSFKLNPQDGLVAGTNLGGAQRSTEEIVTMAASAATRAISVDFNSVRFNSGNTVDTIFA